MKKIHCRMLAAVLFLLLWGQAATAQSSSLYSCLNGKSWSQILAEDTYKWRPPYSVNLLIQPVHSPDWIYVNPSMVVSRRRVTEGVFATDRKKAEEAAGQSDLVVHFAFDDPVFIPDFRLTDLRLKKNKYPVVEAGYFANDIYYKIEYSAVSLDSRQTLLCLHVTVKNEGGRQREVHVRTKIGYYPENEIFDYHYIPYHWTAARWKPYEGISLEHGVLYKENRIIGEVVPGQMHIAWEKSKRCTDRQYEDALYPQVWYGSGYALPEFRVKDMQDVVHAFRKIRPGETAGFALKLLVDDDSITPAHLDALAGLPVEEIESKALAGFERQFGGDKASFDFQACQWGDILAGLQLNTLQLLVGYPGKEALQPAQGGSSERFYVWVFEAVQMLRPLLRLGRFDAVKRALDYIFALQDAGCPPEGRFTTTQGAVGTTGPRWANTTGMALTLACDYYLYSKDRQFVEQYLPDILKAAHWILNEVKATRKLNPDGSRPPTYGLMPFAVASDGDRGYFVSATDVFSYWGADQAVRLLESIHHPEAGPLRKELDAYKSDLLAAIRNLARPDGYIERKITVDDKEMQEASKFEYGDIMAPVATAGIMEPECEVFRKYIDYYENQVASGYFMGKMDRDIYYMIQCEHYWQPVYLTLGEWKKAFMTLQTCLKYGMTQDTHQTQERFSRRDPAFAPWQPNGSGNGGVIDMILNALYFETPEGATLFGCTPFDYLIDNRHTSVKNLYASTGRIDIEVEAIDRNSCMLVLSSDRPLPRRLRIPEHFNARPESPAVEKSSGDVFELKNKAKRVRFRLHR